VTTVPADTVLARVYGALAVGNWSDARGAFEEAVRTEESPVTGERQALEDKQIYAAHYPNMITRLSQTIGFNMAILLVAGLSVGIVGYSSMGPDNS
jgi:hypothetical protein